MPRTPEDLDRTGANSLYEQVSSRIRAWLENLDVGARVPTEAELGAIFKVGRMTVRKAVQCLVDEGLLVRRQGMGTRGRLAGGQAHHLGFERLAKRGLVLRP